MLGEIFAKLKFARKDEHWMVKHFYVFIIEMSLIWGVVIMVLYREVDLWRSQVTLREYEIMDLSGSDFIIDYTAIHVSLATLV
jgi:hypothetical protein